MVEKSPRLTLMGRIKKRLQAALVRRPATSDDWIEKATREWSRGALRASPQGAITVDPNRMPVSREQADRAMEALRKSCGIGAESGADQRAAERRPTLNVYDLAQFIRVVDGNHALGAAELAEKIIERFGCDHSASPGEVASSAEWREEERLRLLNLRHHLDGFSVRVVEAPLEVPATHLEEVVVSREFQPGHGLAAAEVIRGILTEPERAPVGSYLHPRTADLVQRFSAALAAKLAAAQSKRGLSVEWAQGDWMDECRQQLQRHVQKGDPLDVAAYCAFLWHHGESTAGPGVR